LADAILRDSEYEEEKDGAKTKVPFRSSRPGKTLNSASQMNALPVYQYCPTALLFGMWDSTGPKGGLGAKFERAFVSEVIGVNANFGIKTASRIDPLIGATKGIVLYQHQDKERVWTLDPESAAKDASGNPIKLGKKDPGKVSNSNLGNVTPGFAKYGKGAEGYDPMQARNAYMNYQVSEDGRQASVQSIVELERPKVQPERGIAPGGVTIDHAEQLTTISLIALRSLRFPIADAAKQSVANNAAQTVLASLGLCAATLAFENGMGLRSRCLLWPETTMDWELLEKPGADPVKFTITSEDAMKLLADAVEKAKEAGITWEENPVKLTPGKELVKLVRLSQLEAIKSDGETTD
jgi:CRISPR-associated protein Csb1